MSQKVSLLYTGEVLSSISSNISNIYNIKCSAIYNEGKLNEFKNSAIKELRSNIDIRYNRVSSEVYNYDTIILLGDLSENISIAILPLLASFIKTRGKNVYTIAIMPYKTEYNKLYYAKLSLDHLKNNSDRCIIIDKDDIISNDPNITSERVKEVVNNLIINACKILLTNNFKVEDKVVLLTIQNGLLLLTNLSNKFKSYDPLSKLENVDSSIDNSIKIGHLPIKDIES